MKVVVVVFPIIYLTLIVTLWLYLYTKLKNQFQIEVIKFCNSLNTVFGDSLHNWDISVFCLSVSVETDLARPHGNVPQVCIIKATDSTSIPPPCLRLTPPYTSPPYSAYIQKYVTVPSRTRLHGRLATRQGDVTVPWCTWPTRALRSLWLL